MTRSVEALTPPGGERQVWAQAPPAVRERLERLLGSPVVRAQSQRGGFSPGLAERVELADGRRVFLKAAGEHTNPDSLTLHAKEIHALVSIPQDRGIPVLLDHLDEPVDGERWVALVIEDIDGTQPSLPWSDRDLDAALDAYASLASTPLPDGVALPRLEDGFAASVDALAALPQSPLPGVDRWVTANAAQLAALAPPAREALAGEYLVHGDARSDNLLLTPAGPVRIVDWAHASRGGVLFDTLVLLFTANLYGTDVSRISSRLGDLGSREEHVQGLVAVVLVHLARRAVLPAPPGLPTIRAFQRAHVDLATVWLKEWV